MNESIFIIIGDTKESLSCPGVSFKLGYSSCDNQLLLDCVYTHRIKRKLGNECNFATI